MKHKNEVEFRVYGKRALFSDPLTRVGGEKFSYPVPTYQALKGILESVYWKPTFTWVVDEVRIMKPIATQSVGVRPLKYNGGNDLATYTYLTDVDYHVRAHFIWNEARPDLAGDRNEHKHYFIAKRMLALGGRRDVFLGTRECQGYAEPCGMDDEEGAYDGLETLTFGTMFHSFSYPGETGGKTLSAHLWMPRMEKGRILFCEPEECPIRRELRSWNPALFTPGVNLEICDALADELGWEEEKG